MWKAATKRARCVRTVHDFRRLLKQLGTLTMNRIESSVPGKPGFDALGADADLGTGAAAAKREGSHAVAPLSSACPAASRPESKNLSDVQSVFRPPPPDHVGICKNTTNGCERTRISIRLRLDARYRSACSTLQAQRLLRRAAVAFLGIDSDENCNLFRWR